MARCCPAHSLRSPSSPSRGPSGHRSGRARHRRPMGPDREALSLRRPWLSDSPPFTIAMRTGTLNRADGATRKTASAAADLTRASGSFKLSMRAVSALAASGPNCASTPAALVLTDQSGSFKAVISRGTPRCPRKNKSFLATLERDVTRELAVSAARTSSSAGTARRPKSARSNRQVQAMFIGHAQAPGTIKARTIPTNGNGTRQSRSPGTKSIKRPTRSVTAEGNQTHTRATKRVEFEFHVIGSQRQQSRQNHRPPQREQYEEGTETESEGGARSGSKPVKNRGWHHLGEIFL